MGRAAEALTYTETTRDIRITVLPEYLDHESDPEQSVYTFAYTILIENHGPETVQLLTRHWIVNSGGAQYTEVRGDGVVGEQPILRAGDAFQYTSGSVIKDPVGTMYGTYTFRPERGDAFDVTIPRFDLIYPELIH